MSIEVLHSKPAALAAILLLTLHAGVAAQVCNAHDSRVDDGLADIFASHHVDGTFVLYDAAADRCTRFNVERAATRFLPASTFKIFNTMVALDERSIADEKTVLKWDGVDRGSAAWNRDQDMRAAFRASTVWFYQELARRTGEQRMRGWLEKEHYGNADPSGGIDRFWLSGGLRISADEQVDFVYRLYRRQLGFSRRAQDIANDILTRERGPDYVLKGKTGWTESDGKQLGWLVGYIEKNGNTFVYAMNFDSPDPDYPVSRAREEMLRELLARLKILPAKTPGRPGM